MLEKNSKAKQMSKGCWRPSWQRGRRKGSGEPKGKKVQRNKV